MARRAKPMVAPPMRPDAPIQAEILLDFVTGGEIEKQPSADDAPVRNALADLMTYAVKTYAHRYPRARKSIGRPGTGWSQHGLLWDYKRTHNGEHDALCIFCRASLLTLGAGRHTIIQPLIRRMERHTFECAFRGLLAPDAPYFHAWRCPRSGLQ